MERFFYMACSGCQARVRVWARFIGRYCYCPLCSKRMIVKAPEPSELLNPPAQPAVQRPTQPRGRLRALRNLPLAESIAR